jgi:zinc transport system substrate-binding protein
LDCAVETPPDPRPLVAVSILPQKYVVDRIAGDLVRVEVMIPPGANPHAYEPSLGQLRALGRAAIYVKVGHPGFAVERAWIEPLLAESPNLVVVDCSEGVKSVSGDPHLWLAPRQMVAIAVRVETALERLFPDRGELLASNLSRFRADVASLDEEIRSLLEGKRGRAFLVFHPAWGYFAEAYGLEQIAIEADHREPDPRQLGELIQRAKAERIGTIFVQPQFDTVSAEMIAQEIGARIEPIDPLAYDWDENLRRVARLLAKELAR